MKPIANPGTREGRLSGALSVLPDIKGQVYYLPDDLPHDLPDNLPAGLSASGLSESVASLESEESESDESEPDPVCLDTDLLLRGFWGETLQDLQQTQTRQGCPRGRGRRLWSSNEGVTVCRETFKQDSSRHEIFLDYIEQ
ncbi:hypothetical protein EYF80_014383 [Liparis tanakae]|uniref:Uncharacterized protein n=1 Tax=Liparis tanakae TaxID=230148 RepID=A0A4Z2IBH5_9TELE|nr:hypothetical protein EYF80_014383 [Liparis tanakae]